MHYTKPVLSIAKKIELLQSRGLIIEDEERAMRYISHIGYFRLTGYFKHYQDSKTNMFSQGITFDHILDLYVFDRKLRVLMVDTIEKIEVSVKAHISDYMSEKYGMFWYTDRSLFNTNLKKRGVVIYDSMLLTIQEKKLKSQSLFIKAYNSKYQEETYLPSRMICEELTLGEMSTVYNILNNNDAKQIGMCYNTYFQDLKVRLQLILNIRNISAHHARLWNKKFTVRPNRKDVIFRNIYTIEYSENNTEQVVPNMFNALLIINYMMNSISSGHDLVPKIQELFKEFPSIQKTSMGFDDKRRENFT